MKERGIRLSFLLLTSACLLMLGMPFVYGVDVSVSSPAMSDKGATDIMTHGEINQIIGALRGVYTDDTTNNIGIGGASNSDKLNIHGGLSIAGVQVINGSGVIVSGETDPDVGDVTVGRLCQGRWDKSNV